MTRALFGAWSRRGALLTLLAMTAVVVGGAVAVLSFSEAARTSRWLMSPLLLLGAVAIPSIGRELAMARREEIGLARLRGIRGARLGGVLLAEPLVTIVLGTALGFGLGWLVARLAGDAWLDAGGAAPGSTAVYVALGIALGSLLIVLLGSWATVTEPLSVQVASRTRPRSATTLVLFGSVLVIVGAVVAAFRSRAGVEGDPDVLVLLGPALVGLALGQIAIWALRLLACAVTGATSTSGLPAFLAARRLSRAEDLVLPMRLLVAAAVVGVLALTGASSVNAWVDGGARMATGGPTRVPVEHGAVQAMGLTRALDPDGEHLMAVSVVPNEDRLGERRAYIDAVRFDAVAGDFYADTSAAEAASRVPDLALDLPDTFTTADRLTVGGRLLEKSRGVTTGLLVRLDYVNQDDSGAVAEVLLRLRDEGDEAMRTARLPGCKAGCQITQLSVGRGFRMLDGSPFSYDDSDFRVLLTRLDLGDRSLFDLGLSASPTDIADAVEEGVLPASGADFRVSTTRPDGLEIQPLPEGDVGLDHDGPTLPVPEFAAGAKPGIPLDVSGNDRVLGESVRFDALPLLGGIGQLTDLPLSMEGSAPTVPIAETSIVVGADTPDELLSALTAATGTKAQSLDDVRRTLGAAAGADQSRAYALMALFCALVALLALAAGVARHLRSYRRDVASLRVLGVGLGAARRAGRVELAALAAVVVLAVTAGGYLAVELLLDGLPLVRLSPASAPLDTAPDWQTLTVPAVLAAIAMLLIGGRARAVRPGATRPSTLREEEGR